jgi:quercetin dioxygenase-like cupin family protein
MKPGDTAYLAPGRPHNARNPEKEPARVLMFSIHEMGKPYRTLAP